MGNNEISGAIPNIIGDLGFLESLFLDTNFLGAERDSDGFIVGLVPNALPSEIGRLTNLGIVDIKDNFMGSQNNLPFEFFMNMTSLGKYKTNERMHEKLHNTESSR